MGKVVTSQGLTEFVQSGKFTNVPDHQPKTNGSGSVEVKPDVKPAEAKVEEPKKALETAETPQKQPPVETETDTEEAEDENGLRPSDQEFSEKTRKRVMAKHRAMREAKEAAAEAERFAEQQFNERKLAEKRAEEALERMKALEAQIPQKPQEPELKEPLETDPKYQVNGQFDWKSYSKDVAKFEAAQAVADERKKQADEASARERTEAEGRMKARFDAVRKAHPDFDEVVEKTKGTEADNVPQHVLNYLFESEKGGELHYYLMKNPVETLRISKMKPILALAELGKLEAKLTEPAKPAVAAAEPVSRVERGGAPAPITPLSGEGTTGIVTDPAKMDFKQLREYERNRRKAKH